MTESPTNLSPSGQMPITEHPPAIMRRGSGSWLRDDNDKRYLDFIRGWAVNALGHCSAQVIDTSNHQAGVLFPPSPVLHNASLLAEL